MFLANGWHFNNCNELSSIITRIIKCIIVEDTDFHSYYNSYLFESTHYHFLHCSHTLSEHLKILLSGMQNHAQTDIILTVYLNYGQDYRVFFSYFKLEMTLLLPKHVLSALFQELISPRVLWKVEETLLYNLVLCGE